MDMTNIAVRVTEQPVQAVREARSKTPVSGAAPTAGEKEQKSVPLYDTYVPEDRSVKQSAGLYRLAHDEDGSPRIEFDRPASEAEETTTNTDAVDQEIQALKKKQEQLKRQLSAATDPAEARKLEQQLSQTESELRQKDNDAYRRQNAQIS